MQLAYSTNAFTRRDLDKALHAIADLGYAAAEILCDRPHWFPGETSPSEVEHIARILEDRGLAVSNLNANTANGYFNPLPPENVFEPALTSPDPELRHWRERYTIEAIKLARQIGGHCISITAGRPTPGCPPDKATGFFVESLKRICAEAAREEIKIGIEYEPGLLIERASEVVEMIERIDSPQLGVNLDIGHSFLNHEDPADTVRLFAGRIWNVHVEDIKANKHFHLVPGDGDLPFASYINTLHEIAYDGYLTVELYSYPDKPIVVGQRAIDYLRPLVANLNR